MILVTGSFAYNLQFNHPRAIDNWEDRNITRVGIQNPYLTVNRIAVEVNFFGDIPVSSGTVHLDR